MRYIYELPLSVTFLSLNSRCTNAKVSMMLKLHPETRILGFMVIGHWQSLREWGQRSFSVSFFPLFPFVIHVYRPHDVLQFCVKACVLGGGNIVGVVVGLLMGLPELWNKAVTHRDAGICILLYYSAPCSAYVNRSISQFWTGKNLIFDSFQRHNFCIRFYFVVV